MLQDWVPFLSHSFPCLILILITFLVLQVSVWKLSERGTKHTFVLGPGLSALSSTIDVLCLLLLTVVSNENYECCWLDQSFSWKMFQTMTCCQELRSKFSQIKTVQLTAWLLDCFSLWQLHFYGKICISCLKCYSMY